MIQRLLDSLVIDEGFVRSSYVSVKKSFPGLDPNRQYVSIRLRKEGYRILADINLIDKTLYPVFEEFKRVFFTKEQVTSRFLHCLAADFIDSLNGQVGTKYGLLFRTVSLIRKNILTPSEQNELYSNHHILLASTSRSEEEFFQAVWQGAFYSPVRQSHTLAYFTEIGRKIGISDETIKMKYEKMHELSRIAHEFL